MIVLRIDNRAHLSLSYLTSAVADQIKARLTSANPAHLENENRGFSRQLIGVLRVPASRIELKTGAVYCLRLTFNSWASSGITRRKRRRRC